MYVMGVANCCWVFVLVVGVFFRGSGGGGLRVYLVVSVGRI